MQSIYNHSFFKSKVGQRGLGVSPVSSGLSVHAIPYIIDVHISRIGRHCNGKRVFWDDGMGWVWHRQLFRFFKMWKFNCWNLFVLFIGRGSRCIICIEASRKQLLRSNVHDKCKSGVCLRMSFLSLNTTISSRKTHWWPCSSLRNMLCTVDNVCVLHDASTIQQWTQKCHGDLASKTSDKECYQTGIFRRIKQLQTKAKE